MAKPEVQKAFYQVMIKRFNSTVVQQWNEVIIPETRTKTVKIIEALPTFHKYIKEEYILKNHGIDIKTDEFFRIYFEETKDRTSKNQIGKYLSKLGIIPKKISNNGGYKYVKSHDELYDIFKKNLWIDETVDLINKNTNDKDVNIFHHSSDYQKLQFSYKDLQDRTAIIQSQNIKLMHEMFLHIQMMHKYMLLKQSNKKLQIIELLVQTTELEMTEKEIDEFKKFIISKSKNLFKKAEPEVIKPKRQYKEAEHEDVEEADAVKMGDMMEDICNNLF